MWRCEVENTIGKRLMGQEAVSLETANMGCDMCRWLEHGYQTALDELPVEEDASPGDFSPAQNYATEILLHRRSFHISSADNPN